MSLPANSDSPFRDFSKKEWTATAKEELDGADPAEKLNKRINGVETFPFYDQTDRPATDYQLPASQNEFLGPRSWLNLPWIMTVDGKKANEQALESLNSGADGVFFDLQAQVTPGVLLKKIELLHCGIVFLTDSGQEDFFHALETPTIEKNNPASPGGAIFWKRPPHRAHTLMEHFKSWREFHPLGIMAQDFPSPVDEIGTLLAVAARQLEDFSVKEIKDALNSVAFSVPVGSDFFLEIAKIKTLRLLWHQLAKAIDPGYASTVFVHARVKHTETQNYEPHGNMFQGTVAAMSGILGGCDALTVWPADQGNPMMVRVARNISTILREESHLRRVSDPSAGSYYLENLTDQLAAKAWEKFQGLMRS